MTRLKQAVCACILACALLPAIAAQAATYYVATTGNNSNPGTSSKPWKTVAYATSKMVAGDTTYVRGGTYNEGIVRFGRSGTKSAPIRLLNAPGEFPIIHCIDGKTTSKGHRVLIQNSAGSKNPIGWITIEGFEIRYCQDNIKMYNGHDLTIRRNWIHHSYNQGIMGNGTRILVDRNRINHNGNFGACSTCTKQHGIYANGTAWTITNSLIYDNLGYGIQMNGSTSYDSALHPAPEFAVSSNWVVANNTMAYSVNAGGMVVWGARSTKARIENNVFYENGVKMASHHSQGITFLNSGTGNTVRNNLAFASGSGATKFIAGGTQGTHYTQSGNIVNTLNPKFVNAAATLPSSPNFALTSGSPAIDKGLTSSATKTSYTNISRPQQSYYDMGAFEFLSSSTSLAAPTSLQLVN